MNILKIITVILFQISFLTNLFSQTSDLYMLMISTSIYLKRPVYHINSYAKPATFLFVLRNQLGDDVFKNTVNEYMRRWNGKHPAPIQLKITYDNESVEIVRESVSVWTDGGESCRIKRPIKGSIKSIELFDPIIPDADSTNNYFKF